MRRESEPQPEKEKTEQLYRVISEEEARHFVSDLKTMVEFWHDKIKPKYIFLNEKRAIPFGYIIKGAWKEAYQGEELPQFFRMDPRVVGARNTFGTQEGEGGKEWIVSSQTRRKLLEKAYTYIRERIKDKNARIVIFDENIDTGSSLDAIGQAIFHSLNMETDDNMYYFGNVGEYKVPLDIDQYDHRYIANRIGSAKSVTNKISFPEGYEKSFSEHSYDKNEMDINVDDVKMAGTLINDPEERKRVLDYIHDLKLVGKKLGEAIKE